MYEKRNREERQGQIHMLCIDDLVPKDHILREIDAAIDFNFIYDEVEDLIVLEPQNEREELLELLFQYYRIDYLMEKIQDWMLKQRKKREHMSNSDNRDKMLLLL